MPPKVGKYLSRYTGNRELFDKWFISVHVGNLLNFEAYHFLIS